MKYFFLFMVLCLGLSSGLKGQSIKKRSISKPKIEKRVNCPAVDSSIYPFVFNTNQNSYFLPEGQWVYALNQPIDYINNEFLLYAPHNYNDPNISSFPAIIFLHGRGESGKNIDLVKRHGLPKFLQTSKNFKFIVISPQCPPKTFWNRTDRMHEFLVEMIKRFKIDPNKVYLTGISDGGSGTWIWAKDYPNDFAAIVPVSGACFSDIAFDIKSIPTWIFHGMKDNTVKIHEDSVLYKNLSSLGDVVRFTVFPKGGHDIWDKTYSNPELYSWLLKFKNQ